MNINIYILEERFSIFNNLLFSLYYFKELHFLQKISSNLSNFSHQN